MPVRGPLTDEAEIAALAARFFDAIEAGDIAAVADAYAPDAIIWHNTDGREETRAENLATLRAFIAAFSARTYARRRLAVFEGGFVQQHELLAVRADGGAVRLAACIVCAVEAGRIRRLEEYFDSAQVAAFVGSRSGAGRREPKADLQA